MTFTKDEIQAAFTLSSAQEEALLELLNHVWPKQRDNTEPKSILKVANGILDGFGVETVALDREAEPLCDYVNLGDTYTVTLLYDHYEGLFLLASWGDIVEETERCEAREEGAW